MITLGRTQKMLASRKTSIGLYLNPIDEPEHEGILLPSKYIPDDITIGDLINVFIYRDSDDRLIATTLVPKLMAYEIGFLRVVSVTDFGAFLDWGLEKDLFLPSSDQLYPLNEGDECLVYIDVDFKNKIYASMKIQKFLHAPETLSLEDRVTGIIYNVVQGTGAFVAIDNRYIALIPEKELFKTVMPGDIISGRVNHIKHDGKVDISLRERSYIERDSDAKKIYDHLLLSNGHLSLNDKSSPEKIKQVFSMSKLSFKKALGKLLKEKKIIFVNDGIKLVPPIDE